MYYDLMINYWSSYEKLFIHIFSFFSQKPKKEVLADILICIEKIAKASSNIKQLQSVGSLLMLM